MTAATRILVLDGQTTQALASVRALGAAGYEAFVASERNRPLAAWSRHCRACFRLVGSTLPAYAELREWATRSGIRVVLPLTERSCLLLNADAAAWQRAGIALGCGPGEMLLQAFDKARSIEHATHHGIPVPPTRRPESLEGFETAALELGLPCLVRPRFSNAWEDGSFLPDRGVAYVTRLEDLRPAVTERRQGVHWPLIQRYVPGRGKGLFVLCDRGRTVGWFAHERLRDVRPTGSGSSLRRSVPLDRRLAEPARRMLEEQGWHGPAMFEYRDDGRHPPWLIEINGRFWGSLQLAIAAGADLVVQWIRILSGEAVPAATDYRTGVTLRWLWGDVKRLAHVAAGPPRGYPERFPTLWEGLKEVLGGQPAGTRIETWDRSDPWPALAEWIQGAGEVWERRRRIRRARPAPRAATGVEYARLNRASVSK